jgi:hypothetical protein
MSVQEIISDEEIEKVHANANFGSMDKRDVINLGVLKCASGFWNGSTASAIIKEHGLVNKEYELTAKGRKYLWEAFGDGKF